MNRADRRSQAKVMHVAVGAEDAKTALRVLCRVWDLALPAGAKEADIRDFAQFASHFVSIEPVGRQVIVHVLASHASDVEWPRCERALRGLLIDSERPVLAEVGRRRADPRWCLTERALADAMRPDGGRSRWKVIADLLGRIYRDQPGWTDLFTNVRTVVTLLSGTVEHQRGASAMFAAFATDEEWPAVHACLAELVTPSVLAENGALRADTEVRALARAEIDRQVEAMMEQNGRRLS